jgi:CHAD domain-containing protein/DNA-binding transcriptional regulator YiaG
MTTITHEREQKYEAPSGMVLPPLSDLPEVATKSGPETETLTAEYYDTDDFRLLKARITLRRREGGADEGWHLKLPEGPALPAGTARSEIQVPLDRHGDPAPDELTSLVRAHTRAAALRPVARIETRRRKTTLRDATGTSLAEVMTDEVAAQTLGPLTTTVSRWDEIEVELTGGNPKLLRAVDKRLRRGGLRPAGYAAKLERALGIEPPRPRPRLTSHSTAGQIVLGYLDAHAARLKALDPAVRRDQPDAIHQMRVTTRRLRSTLQAFPTILREPATRHLRDELKWLGGVLGDARDIEVLSERLRSELAGLPAELVMGPAQARVRVHFAPHQAEARTAVAEALDSDRYFAILDEIDSLLAHPPFTAPRGGRHVLRAAVRHAGNRTKRRIRRAQHAPVGPDRDVAMHEARKAAKRARYAAEAAEPALGKKARRFTRRMKAVQSALGDQHDAVNAQAAAREIGVRAHLAGENAFTFGLLLERSADDAATYQARARRVWKRARRRISPG